MEVQIFDTTFYRITEKSIDDIRVEHMQLRPFNLKEKGVDYKNTDVFEDFLSLVLDYRPGLIGISATDDTYDLGIELVSRINKDGIHIVVGGVHPTFCPEEVIANPVVDSICVGEGERALPELCLKLQAKKDITHINNIWVKKDGHIFKNRLSNLININSLPYEDFSLFEEKRFFRPMQGKVFRMIPVPIDRGCPFNCAFCAAPLQRKLYYDAVQDQYFRVKSVKRVIDELQHQVKTYKADYIYFNSETFFAGKENDIEIFAGEYSASVGLPFWCQTRIETITKKRIELLEKMNCDRISIGLEHGNEEFRKKVLKKHFTNQQVLEAFRILGASRIPVTVNNIIGFPDETRELAFDTIKLNRQIRADSINAYFFTPYSGTPLRQYCLEKGYISPGVKTDNLMRSSVLDMRQFSAEEIKGLVRTFPLYVKMPESYFDKIKLSEQLNREGDIMLAELREVYLKEYFK